MITNPEVATSKEFTLIVASALVDLFAKDLSREASQEPVTTFSASRVHMRQLPGRVPRRMRRRVCV